MRRIRQPRWRIASLGAFGIAITMEKAHRRGTVSKGLLLWPLWGQLLSLSTLPLSGCVSSEELLLKGSDLVTPLPEHFTVHLYVEDPDDPSVFLLSKYILPENNSSIEDEYKLVGNEYVSDDKSFTISPAGENLYILTSGDQSLGYEYIFANISGSVATVNTVLKIDESTMSKLYKSADEGDRNILRDVKYDDTDINTLLIESREALVYLSKMYSLGVIAAHHRDVYYIRSDESGVPPNVIVWTDGVWAEFSSRSLNSGAAYGNSSGCSVLREEWEKASDDMVLVTEDAARRWEQECQLSDPNDQGKPMNVTCSGEGAEWQASIRLFVNPAWPDVMVYSEARPDAEGSEFVTELNRCE